MHQDRRRHPRREMVIRAQTSGGVGRHDVTCLNAGPGGGYFSTKLTPDIGEFIEISLRPPGDRTPAVVVSGKVIHVQTTATHRAPGFAVEWMAARSAVGADPIMQLLTRAFGIEPGRIVLDHTERESVFSFQRYDGRSVVRTLATSVRVAEPKPAVSLPTSRISQRPPQAAGLSAGSPSGSFRADEAQAPTGANRAVPSSDPRGQPHAVRDTGGFSGRQRDDEPVQSSPRLSSPRQKVVQEYELARPPRQQPETAPMSPTPLPPGTDSSSRSPHPSAQLQSPGQIGWTSPPPAYRPEESTRSPFAASGPAPDAQAAAAAQGVPDVAVQPHPESGQRPARHAAAQPAVSATPQPYMPQVESMSPFVARPSNYDRQPPVSLRSPVPVPPPAPIPAMPLDPAGMRAQRQGYVMQTSRTTGPAPAPSARSPAVGYAAAEAHSRKEAAASSTEWPAGVPAVLAERYQNLIAIGRGASGIVYRAHDDLLDRPVVLKFLMSSAMADDVARRYFVREVKVASQLRHPHIVLIHDIGKVEGLLYYAMEWVDGQTLGHHLKPRTPVTDGAFVWSVVHQVADALDYAHGQGILHRDVKPDNVMVTRDGMCKLVDFGLARRQHEDFGERTLLVGTPHYMAPEQLAGKQVGPAADQYALGIIVYRMLTGFLPFGDSNVFVAHLTEMPRDPRAINPRVPALAVAVVERMLAKRPEERYVNCAEAASALRWALLPP